MSMTDGSREAKEALNFYVKSRLAAAVRAIAQEHETSVSEVLNDFVEDALNRHRAQQLVLRRVRVLQQSLPKNIVDPPDDHPVYGGKRPVMVVSERRWDPSEYIN
jgi:ABC-type phosphonate transport system ATPase subunit